MAVIIDMAMPKSCEECYFYNSPSYRMWICPNGCPLKEVKEFKAEGYIRKGIWKHPYRSDIACECSVCHIQMPITNDFHYCPNCGAKMVESQKSEDNNE